MADEKTKFDKIIETCLKRGIFYPNSEIYGSLAGFYDYGSVGARIKNNWQNYWRQYFLRSLKEPFYEIDPTNITAEKVWKASGHLDHFDDPVVQCTKCKSVERADQALEKAVNVSCDGMGLDEISALLKKHNIACSKCGSRFSEPSKLNLMFGFETGSFEGKTRVSLRPETAQCPYIDFKREFIVNRERIPLGLAVVGKAFRNEISPRRAFFRMREFTQAECQIFFNPKKLNEHERFEEVKSYKIRAVPATERDKGEQIFTAEQLVKKGYPKFCVYYMARVQQFYESLGVPIEKLRFFEKNEKERAFYNKMHFDVEVFFDMFGDYMEVAGFHYRGDHDLSGHQTVSGENMTVTKDGDKFIPHVLELSFGVDRNIFALMDLNYHEENERMFISLPKQVVPYVAGIYPLMKKDGLAEKAEKVYETLFNEDVFYDDSGSIGKRYARGDEISVLYGITVDHDTLEDDTVTVRNRDTTKQERVKISELKKYLSS